MDLIGSDAVVDELSRTLLRAAEVASAVAGLRPEPWMLEARVEERMRATGALAPEIYRRLLDDGQLGAAEQWALVEALRVGETRFFRHPRQLADLARGPLAELALRLADRRRVRAWSAGCATGQEPLTLAMLLCDVMAPDDGWRIEVHGSDISLPSLEIARRGFYPAAAAADVATDMLARHFVADEGGYRVRPELARLVRFAPGNLLEATGPRGCDLVVCRNVLIHFDAPSGERAAANLVEGLGPGGYLLLGHAESMRRLQAVAGLTPLGHGLYQRARDERARRPSGRVPSDAPTARSEHPGAATQAAPAPRDRPRAATDTKTAGSDRPRAAAATKRRGSDRPSARAATDPARANGTREASDAGDTTLVVRGRHDDGERLGAELRDALARAQGVLVVDLDEAELRGVAVAVVLRRARAAAAGSSLRFVLRATRPGPRRWLRRHGLAAEGEP